MKTNEWNPLKKIIVGDATNAHWPVKCSTFRYQEITTKWKETPVPSGPVNETIIQEANEGLSNLVSVLEDYGVEVLRPKELDFESFDGMYNYCPRDRALVLDEFIIDTPMLYPTRKKEIEAIQDYFDKEVIQCDDHSCIFDAANICRLGKDLLYLVSESGNIEGGKWLQKRLGNDYNVHILDNIYSGVHIDSTISPVRDGLVVINADRINKDNLPTVFKDWDIIWMGKDEIVHQDFHQYPYASNYIALNFLTINPNTIVCDPKQTILREKLDSYDVHTEGVKLKHSRTLGGGHHCVTLDLERWV